MDGPNPSTNRRCLAHSSQTGDRCKKRPVRGATVCASHGASASQVKARAQQRLLSMVFPALDTLRELMSRADSDSVRLAAAKYVLEYAGFKVVERVETQGELTINVQYVDQPIGYLMPAHHNGHTAERA